MKVDKAWITNIQKVNTKKFLYEKKYIGEKYGYFNQLLVRGVGFKVWANNRYINMDIGLTHYVSLEVPKEIKIIVKKIKMIIYCHDEQKLNNFIYLLRQIRLPDVYKGKGIRLYDENLKLKVGKVKN